MELGSSSQDVFSSTVLYDLEVGSWNPCCVSLSCVMAGLMGVCFFSSMEKEETAKQGRLRRAGSRPKRQTLCASKKKQPVVLLGNLTLLI